MEPPDIQPENGGQPWWAEFDLDAPVVQRLIAHLTPCDAPFRSRHGCFMGSDLPVLTLRRPDVLQLDVHRNGLAMMYRFTADGEYCGQTWHSSAPDAMGEAAQEYGETLVGPWHLVPEGEADAGAYAICEADARRRGPLGPRCEMMTAEQWRRSEDVPAMLRALRAGWKGPGADLVRLTHCYLLASCRTIWGLLPMEESRIGVEVAERYIQGRATRKEFGRAEYQAEGAAFFLEPFEYEPEDEGPAEREARLRYEADRSLRIASLVKGVEAAVPEQLCRLARSGLDGLSLSTRELLTAAAYFVDSAMAYPGLRPREAAIERHRRFLTASLLREMASDGFCPLANAQGASGVL